MGFFDSLSKGWSFVKAALRMAAEHRSLLAPSLYAVLIQIVYWIACGVALVAAHPHWSNGAYAGVFALISLGSFTIFYFFCGVTVNMVDAHLRGAPPSLADGLRDGRKNFLALFAIAAISTVLELLSGLSRDEDSTLGRIIAGVIESVWTTLTFLLVPCIIVEDVGLGDAMERVRALHRGNLLLIGVGEIGVRLVTNLIALVWLLLIFAVEYLIVRAFSGGTALAVGVTVGGTMLSLFAAFSTYLRMAYYTCLYTWAVAVEKEGKDAPAPLPLAVALGRAPRG